jgi:hypothetical protein
MPKKLPYILNKLISNPKGLFLIDCLGACLTAFLLGIILMRLETYFGMPRKALVPLAMLACVYAIYSIGCYLFVGKHWRSFLNAIAIANFIYCCITIGCLVSFYRTLTILGFTYFLSEIIIIGAVVWIEVLAISRSNGMHTSSSNP